MDRVIGGLIAGMLAKLERVSQLTLIGVARGAARPDLKRGAR